MEQWVHEGAWEFIISPENFCIESLAEVAELFQDLSDIGLEDHAQYPTLVLLKEDDGVS